MSGPLPNPCPYVVNQDWDPSKCDGLGWRAEESAEADTRGVPWWNVVDRNGHVVLGLVPRVTADLVVESVGIRERIAEPGPDDPAGCFNCSTTFVRAPNGTISVKLGDLQHVADLHELLAALRPLRRRVEALLQEAAKAELGMVMESRTIWTPPGSAPPDGSVRVEYTGLFTYDPKCPECGFVCPPEASHDAGEEMDAHYHFRDTCPRAWPGQLARLAREHADLVMRLNGILVAPP